MNNNINLIIIDKINGTLMIFIYISLSVKEDARLVLLLLLIHKRNT